MLVILVTLVKLANQNRFGLSVGEASPAFRVRREMKGELKVFEIFKLT